MKRINNPPKAKFLMGSMRHMGYSFPDAVADVMDNSVSAGCKTIKLLFPTTPENIYVGKSVYILIDFNPPDNLHAISVLISQF